MNVSEGCCIKSVQYDKMGQAPLTKRTKTMMRESQPGDWRIPRQNSATNDKDNQRQETVKDTG